MATTKSTLNFDQIRHDVQNGAREVWLAGLGMISVAEEEGEKLWKTFLDNRKDLMKKGEGIEKDVVAFGNARRDEIEKVFNNAVDFIGRTSSSAFETMGFVPNTEVETLSKKVDALTEMVEKLSAQIEAEEGAKKTTAAKKTTTAKS